MPRDLSDHARRIEQLLGASKRTFFSLTIREYFSEPQATFANELEHVTVETLGGMTLCDFFDELFGRSVAERDGEDFEEDFEILCHIKFAYPALNLFRIFYELCELVYLASPADDAPIMQQKVEYMDMERPMAAASNWLRSHKE